MANQYIIYIDNPYDRMYQIQHYYVKAANTKLDALNQLADGSYVYFFGLNTFVIKYDRVVRNRIRDRNLLNLYKKVTGNTNIFNSGPHEQKYIEAFLNERNNDVLELLTNEEFLAINPFFKILLIPNVTTQDVTFLE